MAKCQSTFQSINYSSRIPRNRETRTSQTYSLRRITEEVETTENVPLNDRQNQIIAMIVANAYITAEMIAKKINVTDKTIKRDIELLKKQKIIVRIGSRKNGYWKVNDV